MRSIILKLLGFFLVFSAFTPLCLAQGTKTVGGTIIGSIQLVDTLPVVDAGIGGGIFFDYRFNDRFSLMTEAYFTTQTGTGRSAGEGRILALGVPTVTLKLFILNNMPRFDPYFGLGLGLYALTEGSTNNNTGGFGLGAQLEAGVEILIAENLMAAIGGTYHSVGLINSFSGNANATTYMPYTLFGRLGYRW